MMRARYFKWMTVFEWFQTIDHTPEVRALYGLLNEMWHEDRKRCEAQELAAYSGAWTSGDIDIEPQFQAFMREMNKAFRDRDGDGE